MAISYVEVDTEQLKRDTQELKERTNYAGAVLEDMVKDIEELNTMWSGEANQAFCNQFQNDVTMMEMVLEKMQMLAKCMEFAAAEYVKCETDVKVLVDSIRI